MRPGCGAGGGGAARDRGPGAALHHRAGRDPAPALAASQGQAARHTTSGLSPVFVIFQLLPEHCFSDELFNLFKKSLSKLLKYKTRRFTKYKASFRSQACFNRISLHTFVDTSDDITGNMLDD